MLNKQERKGEKHPLFKKEARVTSNGKNGFTILANGKEKICNSKDKNFEWKIIDLNKAIKTIKEVYELDL